MVSAGGSIVRAKFSHACRMDSILSLIKSASRHDVIDGHSCFARFGGIRFQGNGDLNIATPEFLNSFHKDLQLENKSKIIRRLRQTPVSLVWHYIKSLLLLVFLSRLASHAGSPV
jgi:hypothetical protein